MLRRATQQNCNAINFVQLFLFHPRPDFKTFLGGGGEARGGGVTINSVVESISLELSYDMS